MPIFYGNVYKEDTSILIKNSIIVSKLNGFHTVIIIFRSRQPQILVDNTALAARLSNRLLMALYKESDNSDDPALTRQVDASGDKLKAAITPFVENGKAVASNPNDQGLITAWRMAANKLLDIIAEVTRLFADLNMYGYDSNLPRYVFMPVFRPKEFLAIQNWPVIRSRTK